MKYTDDYIVAAGEVGYDLISFDWSLIDICNYSCTYCSAGFGCSSANEKSRFYKNKNIQESYKNVLKMLSLSSIPEFEVSLVGGEPTLHPNLSDIIISLDNNKNCRDVSVVTNTSKPASYFEKLDSLNASKLSICSSIHFEHYKNTDMNKYLYLASLKHINFEPIIMLHDDTIYWDDMISACEQFLTSNIPFSVTFIEDNQYYQPHYTDTFYTTFSKYINTSTDNRYTFKSTSNTYTLSRDDIHRNNLKTFKGWTCTPLLWLIDVYGSIKNACTFESSDIAFKNLIAKKTCPLNQCSCDIKWKFNKYK